MRGDRALRTRGDDGFSLMDVVVGMAITGIVMALFTGSIVLVYGSSNRTQAVARTSGEITAAFTWLDRQIRYADYVAVPGRVAADGGNWYVEFENATTVPATCYQLRLDGSAGQLQQRNWTPGGVASSWQPLAGGVTNGAAAAGSADQPFTLVPVGAGVGTEQLAVTLIVAAGGGSSGGGATTQTSVTLPALNTTGQTLAYGTCTGMRP
jgi:Tfp pilus assembly protein PilW